MPITIWNPPAQSVKPPSLRVEELKRKGSRTDEDGDSLLSHPDSRFDPIDGSEPSLGCETIYWDSLPDFFFFSRTGTCGYGPHIITGSKYHIHIKRTTTGVVSIKIYTHLPSPIYKYKTVLLHLQIRTRNLHVVNPYKCVGPAVCGCFQTSSLVPTRIKNPC